MNVRKQLIAVAAITVAVLISVGSIVPPATAQQTPTGSADFRNAPQLPPGQYGDRIVTGDTAWYALAYTNNTPYRFEVSFDGGDPGPTVDLMASFVAPTLTVVDGPAEVVSGDGVEYPAGHTNVWFLKVTLSTTGQAGVEYPILISVAGVQHAAIDDCADIEGCSLDDEFASLNVELAAAQVKLDELRSAETKDAVEAEIENQKGFAETTNTLAPAANARLANAEAQMAALCAPDPMCDEFPDPGSKTPLVGWLLGLAALGFGVQRAFGRLRADVQEVDDVPPPRQPAAFANARDKS